MEGRDQKNKSQQLSTLNWKDLNKKLDARLQQYLVQSNQRRNKGNIQLSQDNKIKNIIQNEETTFKCTSVNRRKRIQKLKDNSRNQSLNLLSLQQNEELSTENSIDEESLKYLIIDFDQDIRSNLNKKNSQENKTKKDYDISIKDQSMCDSQNKQFVYSTPIKTQKVVSQTLLLLFQKGLNL